MNRYGVGVLGLWLIAGAASAENWTDKVSVGGDLRYRHEMRDEEKIDKADGTRHRQRIRARVGLKGEVNDHIKVGFRLATGPGIRSTNTSLDGSWEKKSFNLDLAYFEWAGEEGIKVIGGKMKIPVYRPGKSELMFDDDLTPEGLTVSYDSAGGNNLESGQIFANFNTHWLDEKFSSDENRDHPDSILIGGQLGFRWEAKLHYTLGVGFYDFTSVKGREALPSFSGNSETDGVYDNEFSVGQIFFEAKVKGGGRPVSIFMDYLKNNYPKSLGNAYLIGFKCGKVKKAWGFSSGLYLS